MCHHDNPQLSPRHFRSLTLFTLSARRFLHSALLSGCAAVHTSIAKADLDVSDQMSDSVFLDPVGIRTNAPSLSRSGTRPTNRTSTLNPR